MSIVNSNAQTNLDTLKIDSIIMESCTSELVTEKVDPKIIQTIQAIDKNINYIILDRISYTPKKMTIIESTLIDIYTLADKREAIENILSDTTLDYLTYWNNICQDTVRFLSNALIKDLFNMVYPDCQYPKLSRVINPLAIQSLLHCRNFQFYNDKIDSTIDAYGKKIDINLLSDYFNYLSSNIDYFSLIDKKIQSKSIRIKSITFGNNNFVYAGVDIYGSHYQLVFDTDNSWHLDLVKKLWVY